MWNLHVSAVVILQINAQKSVFVYRISVVFKLYYFPVIKKKMKRLSSNEELSKRLAENDIRFRSFTLRQKVITVKNTHI